MLTNLVLFFHYLPLLFALQTNLDPPFPGEWGSNMMISVVKMLMMEKLMLLLMEKLMLTMKKLIYILWYIMMQKKIQCMGELGNSSAPRKYLTRSSECRSWLVCRVWNTQLKVHNPKDVRQRMAEQSRHIRYKVRKQNVTEQSWLVCRV